MPKKKTRRRSTRSRASKTVRRKASNPWTAKKLQGVAVAGIGYGAVRGEASALLSQLTGSLPVIGQIAGQFGDEVLLGTAGYFMAKKMKNKTARNVGAAMLMAEAVSLGRSLRAGGLGGSSPATPAGFQVQ